MTVLQASELEWITPTGTIANATIGREFTTQLLVANLSNNGALVYFSLVGGELPPGMTMNQFGAITGTPYYSGAKVNAFNFVPYNFVVRAISQDGFLLEDRKFSIIVSNIFVAGFIWSTPEGDLGTVPNNSYYEFQFQTTDQDNVTFEVVSGQIPIGLQFLSSGLLKGLPTVTSALAVDLSEIFRFTVRATNTNGQILDRAFSLSVTNVAGPIIQPESEFLGVYFDGSYYSQQLQVLSLNPNVQIEWKVVNGTLPGGISLSDTGVLNGFITPLQLVGNFGPANYDGYVTEQGVITEQAEYDFDSIAPYDFNQINSGASYTFTVRAYDGANFDLQTYTITILSRGGFTADSTELINDTYITVDSTNAYIPILKTQERILPAGRAGSYYAFKLDGYDYQGDAITYSIANETGTFDAEVPGIDNGFDYNGDNVTHASGVGFDSSDPEASGVNNLPGLILDASSGWIYGKINPQVSALETYRFGIVLSKTRDSVTVRSAPIFFTLPILGDILNTVEWVTSRDLGYIDNGSISELFIEARSTEDKNLIYSMVDQADIPCRLPQGLQLTSTGNIKGRVTFESFTIDGNKTTFDKKLMSFDRTYRFYVTAITDDGTASSTQEFIIRLRIINNAPYNNLYLTAMPQYNQRQIYQDLINDTSIFDPTLLYRPDDPRYGVQQKMSMLFLPGLNPKQLSDYQSAMLRNHYTKTYNFGDIKTATVYDENFEVKYEVVYVEVADPELNSNKQGTGLELDLTNVISNPYIDEDGNEYKVLYPNNSNNMIERMVEGVDYQDRSSLPPWMTSNQPTASGGNTFSTPLGYTRAVVVAYAKPGAGKLIAYRLKNSNLSFKDIMFTVDRYQIDDFYSSNFVYGTGYISGTETTFDLYPKNVGELVATVNYAVNIPFDQIDGRSITFINSVWGGIDGKKDWQDGDTIVFAKQENYDLRRPFEGWVSYSDGWIGDNILTEQVEGYDSGGWDTYQIIPGYLQSVQTAQNLLGDGITARFYFPGITDTSKVYINGTAQPTSEYIIVDNFLIFNTPPPLSSPINPEITVFSGINQQSLTGANGSVSSWTLSPTIATAITLVTITGVSQNTANYAVTTTTINAGSFDIGTGYVIVDVGDTNWTSIGSAANVSGTIFTASDVGSGTGTAKSYTITFTSPPQPINANIKPTISVVTSVNQRGGVWRIKITGGIVNLEFVQEIQVNQRLRVVRGNTYAGSVIYYDPILTGTESVPSYKVYNYDPAFIPRRTTFNNDTTKFFSYRDEYYTPGSEDKYLKFPQYGVFK